MPLHWTGDRRLGDPVDAPPDDNHSTANDHGTDALIGRPGAIAALSRGRFVRPRKPADTLGIQIKFVGRVAGGEKHHP